MKTDSDWRAAVWQPEDQVIAATSPIHSKALRQLINLDVE